MKTACGCQKAPTKFFPSGKLIPVFPPIDESTWLSKVVGILIKCKPLLKILEANPHTSPQIPPPTEIRQSFLVKFFFSRIFTIEETVFKFL